MLNEAAQRPPAGAVAADVDLGGEDVRESARLKLGRLKAILTEMGHLLVAFSGGVDSTFLVKAAREVLGDGVAALTATSPTYPEREFKEACRLAAEMGVRHIVAESNELEIPNFAENTEDRCYLCKSELFQIALNHAAFMGISIVADGSNADDLSDYRPGRTAAGELGIRSPLQEAALTKQEIRVLSKEMGLATWNKPSFACLSSRFPYGTRITGERLDKVNRGEDLLRDLGFNQFRVRYHGDTVRLEVEPGAIGRLVDEGIRAEVVKGFKDIGFIYVTVDLEGYRTGSMNEPLKKTRG